MVKELVFSSKEIVKQRNLIQSDYFICTYQIINHTYFCAVSYLSMPTILDTNQTPFFVVILTANHRFISFSLVPRMRWVY